MILRWLRIAMLGLILLAVALASALTAMRLAIHGREVRVPKIVGLSRTQAQSQLAALGLFMDVENRYYSADVPQGAILSQYPPPNDKVRRGWRVRVAESLGPQQSEVPDLVGQSSRAAEINVTRQGFTIAHTAQIALVGAPGTVVAQSPTASAREISTPKIDLLVVAQGKNGDGAPNGSPAVAPSTETYLMPDLVGKPIAVAVDAAQRAGFKVSVRNVPAAPSQTRQIVTAQDPPAGERITTDRVIALDVGH